MSRSRARRQERRTRTALLSLVGASSLLLSTSAQAAYPFHADSEWTPLLQGGGNIGDVTGDGNNNGREIVGSEAYPAVYIYQNGEALFLRLTSEPR